MHQDPCRPWTLGELAGEAATSRSVLAERFTHFVGESPMTYLARWRLQLAARHLQATRQTVIQIAAEVGYESEAAFNRAFKREFGLPPAQYRKKCASENSVSAIREGRSTPAADAYASHRAGNPARPPT
jgi:AraC-like DNA-binding protein